MILCDIFGHWPGSCCGHTGDVMIADIIHHAPLQAIWAVDHLLGCAGVITAAGAQFISLFLSLQLASQLLSGCPFFGH